MYFLCHAAEKLITNKQMETGENITSLKMLISKYTALKQSLSHHCVVWLASRNSISILFKNNVLLVAFIGIHLKPNVVTRKKR